MFSDIWRTPRDQGLLPGLGRDGEVGGRVGGSGDARRPGQPVRDGVVGVVEVEVVLSAGQTVRELDRVFDLRRREGRVGRGVAVRGPAATIQCANLTKIKQQEKYFVV